MINDLNDYSRQLAVLKRMVLALPATDGTSREYRTSVIEQLNLCLRIGAQMRKFEKVHDEAIQPVCLKSSFAKNFEGLLKGIQTVGVLAQGLKVGAKELDKLRAMLDNPLAKAYIPPPSEMSNKAVSQYLEILVASLAREGKLDGKTFDTQLLQEAIKRLGM